MTKTAEPTVVPRSGPSPAPVGWPYRRPDVRSVDMQLGRRWLEAVDRRDAEALVRIADPAIEVHPLRLSSRQVHYHGHDGLRQWTGDLIADASPHSFRAREIRRDSSGLIVILGQQLILGGPISEVVVLLSVRDDAVATVRYFLSDEETLRYLGHIDG